jgi:hypothetical protein
MEAYVQTAVTPQPRVASFPKQALAFAKIAESGRQFWP